MSAARAANVGRVEAAAADGALVETWVAGELKKWADLDGGGVRLTHWRSRGGEVDFLIERGGSFVAVEVKSAHRIDSRDRRAMRECRMALGRAFVRAIVLYRGAETIPLGERIHAVPLTLMLGERQ